MPTDSIESFFPQLHDRWADGWLDRNTVSYCPDRREARLEIGYYEPPAQHLGWWYSCRTVRALMDRVVMADVEYLEVDIRPGEVMLWLSTIRQVDGNIIEFPGTQGIVRVCTSAHSCRVTTIAMGWSTLRALCGAKLWGP